MESLDVFLIALVIILIIIIVYQNRKFFDKSQVATTAHVAEHMHRHHHRCHCRGQEHSHSQEHFRSDWDKQANPVSRTKSENAWLAQDDKDESLIQLSMQQQTDNMLNDLMM